MLLLLLLLLQQMSPYEDATAFTNGQVNIPFGCQLQKKRDPRDSRCTRIRTGAGEKEVCFIFFSTTRVELLVSNSSGRLGARMSMFTCIKVSWECKEHDGSDLQVAS